MPMIAGPKGYEPTLEVHLDTVAVTSSLNDIRLISAESCRVCLLDASTVSSPYTNAGSLRSSITFEMECPEDMGYCCIHSTAHTISAS